MRTKSFLVGVITAFALNLVWENAQASLYEGHPNFFQFSWMCSAAAVGDVVIIGGLYLVLALFHRDWSWYGHFRWRPALLTVGAGAMVASAIEWCALATGRWRYTAMPIIPVLDVGLVPVLQMMTIPVLVFWLVSVADRREAYREQTNGSIPRRSGSCSPILLGCWGSRAMFGSGYKIAGMRTMPARQLMAAHGKAASASSGSRAMVAGMIIRLGCDRLTAGVKSLLIGCLFEDFVSLARCANTALRRTLGDFTVGAGRLAGRLNVASETCVVVPLGAA